MTARWQSVLPVCAAVALAAHPVSAQYEAFESVWGGPANRSYEEGFVENVRRLPEGGVGLFDMDLIENDAPGSGKSEKGISHDTIWGPNRARKVFRLDDPRAHRAYVVVFSYAEKAPPFPLQFTVNGVAGQITQDNAEAYRWASFPASALKPGDNLIELFCPEAKSEEEGWPLYLARADEFMDGGGDPARVGETSFKSTDSGETWMQSPFGEDGNTRAEYTVRVSLDRYRCEGMLATPVIDLWRGDSEALIVPQRRVETLAIDAEAEAPDGADVRYFLRRGTSPNPNDADWGPYEALGGGGALLIERSEAVSGGRYAQVKAVLATRNPLATPVVKSISVRAAGKNRVPEMDNVYVTRCDNPTIRYPSVQWEWEPANRPEFEVLKRRENLDELLAGSASPFESQTRLMGYVTGRWWDGSPFPHYPAWDALSILDRIDREGSGGMCIQHNNVLAGMCIAYGWQARHVNITSHEVCEVWNDEFGKWIYLDAHGVNHYLYDKATGEPQSVLDLHRLFLDLYYRDAPIDWMSDPMARHDDRMNLPVGIAVPGEGRRMHNGLDLMAFARMMPRNNYYEKPAPRPPSHGMAWWPWDGYVNWYDDRTPPKRQYSRHTDRPQDLWPELNKTRVHATSGGSSDALFLRFETYTPNFDHYEVQRDDAPWTEVGEHWTWPLHPGQNSLMVRAVNALGVRGKATGVALNHVPRRIGE